MIYLDNAANSIVDNEVLKTYVNATKKYIANPNSNHKLGKEAHDAIDEASIKISRYFNANKESIIYTSGSTESNNLVIKGIAFSRRNLGNKIIISSLEHSSIVAPVNYLISEGFDVEIINVNSDGIVDIEELKKVIDDKTILVSICATDSEVGTIQPIEKIAKIVKKYPNAVFHTDATQAIGKINIDYSDVDFITFSPHKFHGLNGFGVLVNRNNIKLTPIIHGGKSTTIFRSGTPVTANVLALEKAFSLAIENLENRKEYIKKLNELLRQKLNKIDSIHINSSENCIYNTLNISLIDKNVKEILKKLEENEIYLSTTAACSQSSFSKSVFAITNDKNLAQNTLRISISYKTKIGEIKRFLKIFNQLLK